MHQIQAVQHRAHEFPFDVGVCHLNYISFPSQKAPVYLLSDHEAGKMSEVPKRPKFPYTSSKFLISTESLSNIFKSSMRKGRNMYKNVDPKPEWKKTLSNIDTGGYKNMRIVGRVIKRQLR